MSMSPISRVGHVARKGWLLVAVATLAAACGDSGLSESTSTEPEVDVPATERVDDGAVNDDDASDETSGDEVPSETSGDDVEVPAEASAIHLLMPLMPATWSMVDLSSNMLAASLLVTEPVIAFQPDGTFANLLAQDFQQLDPTTYLITLADGITFSDGTPLTADDVKFSFEIHTAEDTTSNIARYWRDVTSIEVIAENQVQVTLGTPDPDFPYTLAKTGIVSRAYHELHGDQVGTPTVPQLGTGPYTYEAFTPSVSVELVANPGYWGEAPVFPEITMELARDDASRLLALQSGDYDGVYLPPLTQIDQIEAIGEYTMAQNSDVALYRIGLDVTKPPFDEIEVRDAIAHAIDRDAIVAGAFGGRASVANSLVPESSLDILGDPDAVASTYAEFAEDFTFDLDLARQSLAASTVPDGFEIDVPVPASDATVSLIAQTIAQDLAEIGITLNVVAQDDATFGTTIYVERSHDGLTIDSWNAGSPEPGNLPFALLAPGAIGNTAQLDDPAALEAIAAYKAAEPGSSEQLGELIEALTLAHDQRAYVPLAFPDVYAFVDDDLAIREFNSFWWLTPIIQTLVPA